MDNSGEPLTEMKSCMVLKDSPTWIFRLLSVRTGKKLESQEVTLFRNEGGGYVSWQIAGTTCDEIGKVLTSY